MVDPTDLPCLFCDNNSLNFQHSVVVSIVSKLCAHDSLSICNKCCAFINKSSSVKLGAEIQASLHEDLFGTTPTHYPTYINDLKSLRSIIANDYAAYFGDKKGDLIYEVGAGRGGLLKALLDEGYKAFGCEFSGKLVKAGREAYKLPEETFIKLNAWDLPKYLNQNSIRPTVLVFWHVIEHIENSLALLESLREVCSDKITFIFQTPLPVPDYIFPEHLFFPTTETYYFIAERLGLSVKLLYVIPYTRYATCVLSNKDVAEGNIYPKQCDMPGFSVIGQLIAQLDSGLSELDQVTKEQYQRIVRLESQISPVLPPLDKPLTLATDLSQIADFLMTKDSSNNTLLNLKMQQLAAENQGLRNELLRAEAQLALLKDVLLNNLGDESL